MPKVDRNARQQPLKEVGPVAMEAEGAEAATLPDKPKFAPLSSGDKQSGGDPKVEFRRVPVPQHRMTPLKTAWMELYKPITENLKLDMRMNLKTKKVEIKTTSHTTSSDALQKAADFVHAYLLGFEIRDAIALLRLDDLYVECFEIKDVKTLRGEHLSRCIGRLAGKDGKTKFTIENATRTRIVLADTRIHILGSFQNIRVARDALCALILGSPASKVYSKLRSTCSRLNDS
ncbi:pre-rRNA-processing protein pno1 [Pleodorina starrii]|uniref:Pre-rRNA-processing protein pno1 n=1 Tax=Pleodorina starrii TaxID=330485 RepID=A0A9W6BRE7_9CHLO|nr:pre-rRNA-processing protein pno1 [Pleodorina starrii]GLC57071.1 pre-rRNA-processing protein pno1 [Pleodorina starrii]GLC64905.1 pre-rRNA-processing protein pno1 [Pleodorina starrii]